MPWGGRHFQPKPGGSRGGGYLCAHCSKQTQKGGCHNQACAPVYFASRIEKVRAAELLLLRDQGKIAALEFHPRRDLVIHRQLPDGTSAPGQVWRTYVADSAYIDVERGGKRVIEDTKPRGWESFDESARGRIDLFRILFPDENLVIVER